MAIKPPDLISIADAAKMLKVSTQRIHQFIRDSRLTAVKVGRAFVLRRADVLKVERRERGRPKKDE